MQVDETGKQTEKKDKKSKSDGKDKKDKKKPAGDDDDENDEADEDEDDKEDATVAKKHKGGKKSFRNSFSKKSKKSTGEPKKRGPPRPYRKLAQSVMDSRMKKLQRRIERTSAQAEEGRTFLEKYTREQAFRDAEASGTAEPA